MLAKLCKDFCKCGCGKLLNSRPYPRLGYILGHFSRGSRSGSYKGVPEWIAENQDKWFCQCGCGKSIKITKCHHYHRGIPRFIHGHNGKGIKRTPEQLERQSKGVKNAYIKDPTYRDRVREGVRQLIESGKWGNHFKRNPSTLEEEFIKIMPKGIRYIGDGKWWRRLSNGICKNPDFKVDGQDKVIELFGDYYHRNENPEMILALYREAGIDCLIIWGSELKKRQELVLEKVKQFISQEVKV